MAGAGVPEGFAGNVVIVGLDNHVGPVAHGHQVADVFSGVVFGVSKAGEGEAGLGLRVDVEIGGAGLLEAGWGFGVADEDEVRI